MIENYSRKETGTFMDFFEKNGILIAQYHDGVFIDLNVAETSLKERKQFAENKVYPMLINAINVKSITKEARDFFASEAGTELLSASAIFTDSRLTAFLANFFIKVNLTKTYLPVRLFTDFDKAIQWLENYK